jgi:hypothetical protein
MTHTPYEGSLPDDASLEKARDELRARIPGWGADLDPADRPSVPQERFDSTGAHWDFPDRQEELAPREKSIEHGMLTPVFGTSTPLRGLSGALRRLSYDRYSEGRAAHWIILLGADRVDAIESHLASFVTTRPDNPITETGVLSDLNHHAVSSRFGKNRADLRHIWLDPIIVAGPWLLAGWALVRLAQKSRS